MAEPFVVEYVGEGIATGKESWYVDEIAQRQRNQALESTEKPSLIVEETRRRQLVRKFAEDFRLVLEEQARLRQEESDRSLETRFRQLADEWISETAMLSDPVRTFMHQAHLKIIGMGDKVLPLILKEAEKMSADWTIALQSISPVNPVTPDDQGSFQRTVEAWIRWGKAKGLI